MSSDFKKLERIIRKYGKGSLEFSTGPLVGSTAKEEKPQVQIFGKKEVSVLGRKPQKIFVVGAIEHKNFVSFYSMPAYSHTATRNTLSPTLKKYLKGKSCFNIPKLTPELLKEIENHIKAGIKLYKKEGWI